MSTMNEIKDFIITREFAATRDLVWKAWTEKEHLSKWMSPAGFDMTFKKFTFKAGGENHYCQKTPDGNEMWGKWTFQEIDPPKKLVIIQSFSDKDGNVTRHPMSPTWPLQTLSTSTFEEKNGKTIMNLKWTPYEASAESIATFNSATEGMNQGWAGTFAKLEEYLAEIQK
jgi:uncharacterized protein YndB with AHSA1/START domain